MSGPDQVRGEELRYRVPPGQDTAPLIAALHQAGYEATSESVTGDRWLVVVCPNGRDRDRAAVRGIIQESNTTSVVDGVPVDRDVLFEGEHPGG